MFFKNFLGLLKRFTASSVLNVVGMAVAFATAYVIMVQVRYELTFNKSFKDADNIVTLEWPSPYADDSYTNFISRPMIESAFGDNPDVESHCVLTSFTCSPQGVIIRVGDGFETCPMNTVRLSVEIFEVLGIKPLRGDFSKFDEPKTVVLTESTAERLNRDVGGSVCFSPKWVEDMVYSIIAIIPDIPENSDFKWWNAFVSIGDDWIDDRNEWSFHGMAKVNTADLERVAEICRANLAGYFGEDLSDPYESQYYADKIKKVRVIPITKTYFDEKSGTGNKGNLATTRMLIAIALLIIVIAFINFVNFFMAMVPQRLRGVNTYRVYGCTKTQMKLSFLFEAVGLVVIALVASLPVIGSVETSFIASFVSPTISLSSNYDIFLTICAVGLAFAVVANIYPANYITSFPLVVTAKGSFVSSKAGKRLRTMLIGVQFAVSIALIISSLFIKLQHDYMLRHDMGFNKEMLLTGVVPSKIGYHFSDREAFASELKKNPQIVDVAYANGQMVSVGRMGWGRDFNNEEIHFSCYPVSYNFLKFMGIDIVEGEDFSKVAENDSLGTFIFNEVAKNKFGLTLEDKIVGHNKETKIVGFCKDFNFKPLQYDNEPFAFYVFGPDSWKSLDNLYVRVTPDADVEAVIDFIKDEVVRYVPEVKRGYLYYDFFDEELARIYDYDRKFAALITTFSVVSIIISLMGVFGLVLFETQYRRKEIALRRVNGATVREILDIFSSQFVKIVLVCFAVAASVSYFIIDRWLEKFAYRTPMCWWVFVLAFAIVLIITISIVLIRCWKSANANPVEALKDS